MGFEASAGFGIHCGERATPKQNLYGIEKFTYLPETNSYQCPQGTPLKYVGVKLANRSHICHISYTVPAPKSEAPDYRKNNAPPCAIALSADCAACQRIGTTTSARADEESRLRNRATSRDRQFTAAAAIASNETS